MQLLVTTEMAPEDDTRGYSFRLGVRYRHRPGDFDSSGYCSHAVAEDAGHDIRLDCGVDCEGGGINVALSKNDKSAVIRLERITIWQRNKPDDEAGDALLAGADDKIFRLDRAAKTAQHWWQTAKNSRQSGTSDSLSGRDRRHGLALNGRALRCPRLEGHHVSA
jgi:hypothetical protein